VVADVRAEVRVSGFEAGTHGFTSYGPHVELEVDACVIGAGPGGSTAAASLAAAGRSVAVLEEGRSWQPSQFRPTADWAFKHLYAGRGTRTAQGNCVIPMPGGRGVGGSTLINSAICFRTPAPVLAEWREKYGCAALTDAHMGALFDRIWRTIGVTVNPPEVQRENNLIFKKGAQALGLKGDWLARSAPGCVGCGTCQQGCGSGGKWSVDRTFLAEALRSGGVGVYADCRVEGVETEGGRVVAVTGRTIDPDGAGGYVPAGTFRVRARTFVLSAGTVGSPRFLLANGLAAGPVGEHLHIHPTSCILGRFPHVIDPWHGVTQGYYVDCWDEGFLLQTYSTPPDQYFISVPLEGVEAGAFMRDLRHHASAGVVVHDEDSVGSVGTRTLSYSLGDLDRRRLIAGLRQAARVYFAAGATEVLTAVHGSPRVRTPDDIDRVLHDDIAPHDLGLYASHPMGTCRMGADPETSVVDPEGRVRGWDNLFVSDASVFPTSLGVNPQVTVMALGLTIGANAARA
jgi:choline dehydrogenase-like flavoprotein